MTTEKISLYFKNDQSDKVYHIQLENKSTGYVVNFQFGKRNGTLTSGQKTAVPIPYDLAKATYDATVKKQLAKGYSPGESGTAFVGSDLEQRVSGVLPQLLNVIRENETETYLKNPDWFLQRKYDGHCRMIKKTSESVVGINRKGLITGLPQSVIEALEVLPAKTFILHGELMGDVFALFDVLEVDGKDIRGKSVVERLTTLETFKAALEVAGVPGMFGTYTARTVEEKRKLYAALVENEDEGGVFKLASAQYTVGRPNSGGTQLKRVFFYRATVRVVKSHATKRSIFTEALDANGVWTPVGKCTIPANAAVPKALQLVEIEYKYAFLGGSLFQPQYKGVRDDIEESACTLTQLVYKNKSDSEEDELDEVTPDN